MLILIESGSMETRRRAVIPMPPLVRRGHPDDPKSHGIFVRGGVEFEVRICDPNPTYYLWVESNQCHLFPEMGATDE